ncbi:MAG: hypothetical protein LUD81_06065 [Clostridiales bacterium]|nr:hypothetical protein [Clostridiales bacterium]
MKKKSLLIAGTLLLSAVVFTACGGRKSSSETETTETTTETETADTTELISESETADTEVTEISEASAETTTAEISSEAEAYGEGWEYDEETGSWHMYSIPDSVWEEVRQKTGLSEEEFAKEQEKYADLKDSKPYSWDKSEAPLTDEQIKEIEAEQASIRAEMEAAEKAEQESQADAVEQNGGN